MRVFLVIALAVAVLGCQSTNKDPGARPASWPRTLDEAVTRVLTDMSPEDKARVKATKKEDLMQYHMDWGMGIRNEFGLWGGNDELMRSCHANHPDDASMVIIEAVWTRLQKE